MKALRLKNNTIYYRVFGSGDPVIFLHGFLENHNMWNSIAPEIEALGFKTFMVDLPCHGQSRFEEEICTMNEMARAVDVLCAEEELDNPIVFGHSMGGYVGLELLKLRPIKLTLVHSNFWADPDEKKKDRNRVIEIVQSNKMRLINEAIPNLFSVENRTPCQPAITNLINEASTIPAKEICASTAGMRDRLDNSELMNQHDIYIIHGELDGIVKTQMLEDKISKLATLPTVFTIKNCGHMSIWERPEALINHLKVIVFK